MNAEAATAEKVRVPRIDALTGLRFFPALAVLLSHLKTPPWAGPHLKAFMDAGYAGVTVFFVLSGFVLTHNYFDRFVGQFGVRTLGSYLVARLARVYPLYLLMLVWVSFPSLWLGTVDRTRWLEHALGLQAWSGTLRHAYTLNAPGWSVSVEFFLYACFPFLVFILLPVLRKPRRTGIALVVAVALIGAVTAYFYRSGYADLPWEDPRSAHRWLYRNPFCRLGDLVLGMLTARLMANQTEIPRRVLEWGAALSTAVVIALMCWPANVYSAASWDLIYALPAAALIFCLAAAPASSASRWLSTKPLLLLGEASYALYLCHVNLLNRMNLGKLPANAWLVSNGLTLLFVIVFAIGLHISIERPARSWLRARFEPLPLAGAPAAA